MKFYFDKMPDGKLKEKTTGKIYNNIDEFIALTKKAKQPKYPVPTRVNDTDLISFSLIMYGVHKCSGSCVYCSAATPQGYRDNGLCNDFKFDAEAIDKRLIDFCKKSRGIDITKKKYPKLLIDIWGANPLSNMEEFKKTVEYCKTLTRFFDSIQCSTSGNGLEFASDKVLQYMIDNNIIYQLSHDGLGQWQRTGDIDPLYDERTAPNIIKLLHANLLRNINCTLSERNPSFYDNYHYWEKFFAENGITHKPIVKLNKVAPGTQPVNKKWWGKDNPQIKHGEIIGAQTITKNCDIYFKEWKEMYFDKSVPDNYKHYFHVQLDTYFHQGERRVRSQSCYRYQKGYQDWNFAIDTMGYYCACNLVDHDNHCNGEGQEQPDYCKNCKYRDTTECNPCETEKFEETCVFRKKQCDLLEEIKYHKPKFSLVDLKTGESLASADTLEELGFSQN